MCNCDDSKPSHVDLILFYDIFIQVYLDRKIFIMN